jgi:hypothetical protein
MKKFTGTVQTTAPIPITGPPVTTPPIPTITTQSLTTILPSIKKEDGTPVVTYDQALALSSLKFKRGDNILTLTDRYFVFEVVNMLNTLDYEVVYNFLNAGWEKVFGSGPGLRKKILFDNPLMENAKEKLELDMEIYRNKIEVSKGAIDCKKCGSDETLSVEKQTRSADEPMTIMVTCLACNHKWRAQ